ncbi:hypothetical protein DMB66_26835 [Actinoplanes sp. ATCC 53533]|uniref:DUF6745 domain-containing protein n=1 Tax=Actinoplanes sp. ATCC 53533 TaxID=1288362 RepID=UPI000F7B5FED|nr:hypothetical protein [Actinoplanes sp. ATCC 53533]RSM59854.1 hypothetical protein DMB66_26835 [Actinoplanes sp. ATCC 53533]
MIDALTDAQRATFAPFVERCVHHGPDRAPLTQQERDDVVDGLRRCYVAAGLPWPGTVVWVSSPLAGELVALTAALTVQRSRIHRSIPRRALDAVWSRVEGPVRAALGMLATVLFAVLFFSWPGALILVFDHSSSFAIDYVLLFAAFGVFVGVRDGVANWSRRATVVRPLPLEEAVSELGRTSRHIVAATIGVVEAKLDTALAPGVDQAVRDGVRVPIDEAETPIWTGVTRGLWDEAVADHPTIRRDARLAVLAAAGSADLLDAVIAQQDPPRGTAPLHGTGSTARLLWLRRHAGVPRDDDWDAIQGFADAGRVRWWPHPDFVVVSEPPIRLRVERTADGPDRPHHASLPAISWRDGFDLHFWHGIQVPTDLIRLGGDVEAIHRHHNSEVRRAAIERMGWLTYIGRAGLRLVASAPDPGNAPHELLLYEDPDGRLGDARVLVMTNGSPHRSGALSRYAETVPAGIDDPIEAAAWQYNCPVHVYRRLRRRT